MPEGGNIDFKGMDPEEAAYRRMLMGKPGVGDLYEVPELTQKTRRMIESLGPLGIKENLDVFSGGSLGMILMHALLFDS